MVFSKGVLRGKDFFHMKLTRFNVLCAVQYLFNKSFISGIFISCNKNTSRFNLLYGNVMFFKSLEDNVYGGGGGGLKSTLQAPVKYIRNKWSPSTKKKVLSNLNKVFLVANHGRELYEELVRIHCVRQKSQSKKWAREMFER